MTRAVPQTNVCDTRNYPIAISDDTLFSSVQESLSWMMNGKSLDKYLISKAVTGEYTPWLEFLYGSSFRIPHGPATPAELRRAKAKLQRDRAEIETFCYDKYGNSLALYGPPPPYGVRTSLHDHLSSALHGPPRLNEDIADRERRFPALVTYAYRDLRYKDCVDVDLLDPIAGWRAVKKTVLGALESLGLEADAVRTDGVVPLSEHFADEAALIRIRLRGARFNHPAPFPGDQKETEYQQLMFTEHGLTPTDVVPRDTLQSFCGQYTEREPPRYMDHVRVWIDECGDPVLTIEPYRDALTNRSARQRVMAWRISETGEQIQDMPVELAPEPTLAESLVRDVTALPLSVSVHDGLWSPDGTALVMFRHSPFDNVLPAAASRMEVVEWLPDGTPTPPKRVVA